MLDKDRDRRFRSADDLIAALDGVLALPLPEKAEGARPVAADIDRQETRVMPRTPLATTPRPTPVPPPTMIPPPIPGTQADHLARSVPGVSAVSNEIQHDEPADPGNAVPGTGALPPAPPMPGLPALDSALQMMTRDLPVAQLVRLGRQQLEQGRPEAALKAFTAALSLDPGNKDADAGARDAGRQIQARAQQQRPSPPPPRPTQER